MSADPLPSCALIEVLTDKAAQRHDVSFQFLDRLRDLRDRVSPEVLQINRLFPEYTPHDEHYHLKRLFSVADTVLARERLEQLNSAELFVLAAALYAHDWGMAVSEAERQLILTGSAPPDVRAEDLWLLPDERDRLRKFAKDQRLPMDARGCSGEIPVEIWREYVRQTHAFRSGERARRFFEAADGGVAEAVGRACEGHWLDFPQLQDADRYPTDFAVLREAVNLRAVAVYVRLIDLLDLAEDRTPYVLWKFVAPRNPRSRMEWAKHRALRPVTTVPYQEGRILRVDGGTADHEVFAALEDLKTWCDEQFRGCSDLLARMNDRRHRLDLYRIDWRLAPRGFEPVSIQFEFDRGKMFEILSDEIYQGDPYVFLRELLQNSIDAIRMRREILSRKGLSPGDLGMIRVQVEHGEAGDAVVTWHDDGIGMDEHVVRNYLAVAGRSYYRSEDFEREGLTMDPISRFGVGLLSCFMVADRIEIETSRDPYLPPHARPLKVSIPAVDKRFRIQELGDDALPVGTTVKVFVEGRKLPREESAEAPSPLNVTDYLSRVAGFVTIPIIVMEGERRTVILHPKHDSTTVLKRLGDGYEVRQIALSFPWEDAIVPQDLAAARELLREERYDLEEDLGLKEFEGVLVYPVQVDGEFQVGDEGVVPLSASEKMPPLIRLRGEWERREGLSRSARHSPRTALFKDGILLAEVEAPAPWRASFSPFAVDLSLPFLHANVKAGKGTRIDLGRSQLLDAQGTWDAPLRSAFVACVAGSLDDLLTLPCRERFFRMGQLLIHRSLKLDEVLSFFPVECFPVPLLKKGGNLHFVEWRKIASRPIFLRPYLE